MKTAFKLIVATLTSAIAIGCSKVEPQRVQTQQQKTQETKAEAEQVLAELSTSLPQVRTRPEPTEKWTTEELKSYQDLLDSSERGLNKLASLNGKNGVRITGEASLEESRHLINQKRFALQNVRNKIAEQSVTEAKDQKIAQLKEQFERDDKYLNDEGIPLRSWPEERLQKYDDAVVRNEKTLQEMEATAGESVATTLQRTMNQTRRGLIQEARKQP